MHFVAKAAVVVGREFCLEQLCDRACSAADGELAHTIWKADPPRDIQEFLDTSIFWKYLEFHDRLG
jgi:hypothetical protein